MKKLINQITFENEDDARAQAEAEMGHGNRLIRTKVKRTDNQLTYRFRKFKQLHKRKLGPRVAWRNGIYPSQRVQDIIEDLIQVRTAEIMRTTPPLISHPLPKFVKARERKAPTVDQAVKLLRKKNAGWI